MRILDLCSGTHSIERWARESGRDDVEVVSVDIRVVPNCSPPTHLEDVLAWDYASAYAPGHFDVVHASPPCTHYSIARTTAKTPRNFPLADSIVARCLEIIRYFDPLLWTMENPLTGYLKTRQVVAGLTYVDVDYCQFGTPFRKPTRFWTNRPDLLDGVRTRCDPNTCPACPEGTLKHRYALSSSAGRYMPGMNNWLAGRIPPPLLEAFYGNQEAWRTRSPAGLLQTSRTS
jgi:hypothetical protein